MSAPLSTPDAAPAQLHLILLAGGNSRRFGSNKLLWELEGKPLYRHALDKLCTTVHQRNAEASGGPSQPACALYVVTQHEEILAQLREPPYSDLPFLRPVFSPDSCSGISFSIQAGLNAARTQRGEGRQIYAFFTADQPRLTFESIEGFLRAAERCGQPLGCVRCGQTPGNPAFFEERFVPELLALEGDAGGRRVLHAHTENCFYYSLQDPAELADLDTQEDVKNTL